ncbi:MAG: 3-deoxy-manno-octulosonate cytidylyltransferase [Cytophagales bacterium]|nr:3-deoxy-manno-octulosonate cytidylyltransferase [Bernardetiaceae bacterium]MDW8210865.1 3-deoxy-manno-octulosonate cytidylyltransferase [Cytophagales bacterium]
MASTILGIIPARYGSTRFPGKVLADIAGKTMLRRVYEQARQSKYLSELIVATDHPSVAQEVERFGGKVIMTRPDHLSGTDRCFEALQKINGNFSHVINIQADEPFIDPLQIDLVAQTLQLQQTQIATLIIRVATLEQLTDLGEAKVVVSSTGQALYFSRQPIPCLRDIPMENWLLHHTFYRHIGIYGYRSDVLREIAQLPPSPLEQCEKLEQLRWLERGYRIQTAVTTKDSFCVETPEDLAKAIALVQAQQIQ